MESLVNRWTGTSTPLTRLSGMLAPAGDLESGKYNIGKHALEEYGKVPKQQSTNYVLLLVLIMHLMASCKQPKLKEESSSGECLIKYQFASKETNQFISDSIINNSNGISITKCIFWERDNGEIYVQFNYGQFRDSCSHFSNRVLAVGNEVKIPIYFKQDFDFALINYNAIDSNYASIILRGQGAIIYSYTFDYDGTGVWHQF